MKKKHLALLLALVMLVSVFFAACSKKDNTTKENTTTNEQKPNEEKKPDEEKKPSGDVKNQIIIGDGTEMSGDWAPYIQNNATDYMVWKFITGTGTVDLTKSGEYVVNENVVEKYDRKENADGTVTYTWTIKKGLKYHDGSEIKAIDYVAPIAIWNSPEIPKMGGKNAANIDFDGWEDYATGKAKEFKGIRLIDDYTFALTIAKERLPFFYELGLVGGTPEPLKFWVGDDVVLKDDGKGVYLEGFTAEKKEKHVSEARFKTKDFFSCGPYYIESFDNAAKSVVLKANENFVGDSQNKKPAIETVIIKKVVSATALDDLKTGGVDLLTGMASGDEINQGLALVDEGGFAYSKYPRLGYGKLVFMCDDGPTQFVKVRQAIAHLLNRNEFAQTFTGGFGTVVNGPYGEAQWFYQMAKKELDAKLNKYEYDPAKAIALLEEDGWTLDANGAPYKSGIRYKKLQDGKLMPLELKWFSTDKNPVSELLAVKLMKNPDVEKAGMKITQDVGTFPELLGWYYRDSSVDPKYGVPTYQMFNMGTGFTNFYDMTSYYSIDPVKGQQNYNKIFDQKLSDEASSLILTKPGDKEAYVKKFIAFVERWNELLPDLPLYSNIYHDFYNEKLKNYEPNPITGTTDAILYANVE